MTLFRAGLITCMPRRCTAALFTALTAAPESTRASQSFPFTRTLTMGSFEVLRGTCTEAMDTWSCGGLSIVEPPPVRRPGRFPNSDWGNVDDLMYYVPSDPLVSWDSPSYSAQLAGSQNSGTRLLLSALVFAPGSSPLFHLNVTGYEPCHFSSLMCPDTPPDLWDSTALLRPPAAMMTTPGVLQLLTATPPP